MIQIIMLIVGIVALFKKSITVTSKSELRRPKIYTFGIVTILITIIGIIAGGISEGPVSEVLFWLGIIVPAALAILLKEPKVTPVTNFQ